MDNTSPTRTDDQALEINNQATLEAALSAEPVEEGQLVEETDTEEEETLEPKEEPELIMGKYKDVKSFEEAHKSLQKEFTKRNEELKKLQAERKEIEAQKLQSLGYDEQVQYLVEQLNSVREELDQQKQVFESGSMEAMQEADALALEKFISQTPELVETGMDDIFRELASSEKYREYSFESIYNARLKPKIASLMGTKVKTKVKPLKKSISQPESSYDNVDGLGKQDYETNRDQILREAGIKV